MLKCCDSMADFIHTGAPQQPSKPNHETYDKLFGRAYAGTGYHVMGINQFLKRLPVKPSERTDTCSDMLIDLYEASTGKELAYEDRELSLDWEWLFCLSNHEVAPMLMGAVGFESNGSTTYVSYLYTRHSCKQRGVGSRLMDIVEGRSDTVFLYPEDNNSHRWYANRGYTRSEYDTNTWVKQQEEEQSELF